MHGSKNVDPFEDGPRVTGVSATEDKGVFECRKETLLDVEKAEKLKFTSVPCVVATIKKRKIPWQLCTASRYRLWVTVRSSPGNSAIDKLERKRCRPGSEVGYSGHGHVRSAALE